MVAMTSSHIESLPTELVRKTLLYLDKASLLSFSSVSRRCHSYATARLFKTIRFYLWDSTSLFEQVRYWSAILTRYNSHAQVQRLELADGSPPSPKRGRCNPYMRKTTPTSYIGEVLLDQVYQDSCELRTWSEELFSLPSQSAHRGIKDDFAWRPLVDFVSQLPGLSLLICASSNQLSNSVIEWLNQVWPKLRLQMFNTSLVNDSYLPILRPSMAPFLKSALVKLSPGLSEHRGVSQLDFIIHNAPHLREMTIWWAVTDDYSNPVREPAIEDYVSDDEVPDGCDVDFCRAQLDKFQIRVENGRMNYCLDYWAHRVDFTKLRVLKLEGPVRRDCTDWSHIDYTFPSLETFVLNTWQYYWHEDRITHEEYQNGLACFLQRLKPLTELRIIGILSKNTLRAVFAQHGNSLRRLLLEMNQWPNEQMLDPEIVQQLCVSCVRLEDLKISMNRLQGNAVEVNMYRNLGSIPTLRRLHLTLDYLPDNKYDESNYTIYSPPDYGGRREFPSDGHRLALYKDLRKMFINHAVDENLAQSIFAVMDASRTSITPLESLMIEPVESWHPDISTNFIDLFREIGRTYLLVRDPRDTHRNEIKVRELRQPHRMPTDARLSKRLSDLEKALFDQIWPPQQGDIESVPWYDKWYSFPLANVEAETGDLRNQSRLKWVREGSS